MGVAVLRPCCRGVGARVRREVGEGGRVRALGLGGWGLREGSRSGVVMMSGLVGGDARAWNWKLGGEEVEGNVSAWEGLYIFLRCFKGRFSIWVA